MDLDKLSAEEIRVLQKNLAETLLERQSEAETKLIEDIEALIEKSDFSPAKVLSLLQEKFHSRSALYVNPDDPNEIWVGRGRMPIWLKTKIDQGFKKEDFEATK